MFARTKFSKFQYDTSLRGRERIAPITGNIA